MERGGIQREGFGFSWADEVERQEEEEKEKQNGMRIEREREGQEIGKKVRRCDPFGAARPREVILEEKGVDWKKLDQDFSFEIESSIAISISIRSRECKTKAAAIKKKKPLETHKSQHQNVPPLKYPPKNINSVFEQIRRARHLEPTSTVLVAKEKTGSNFEAKSDNDFERSTRRVLGELNSTKTSTSTSTSSKDKVPGSNSSYHKLNSDVSKRKKSKRSKK